MYGYCVAFGTQKMFSVIKNDLTWKTIKSYEDNLQIFEGTKVVNFGSGHAWGMISLEIETEELGTLILASEAIYKKDSMEPALKPPGIIYDSIGWARSVEKIQKLAKKMLKFGWDMTVNSLKVSENQPKAITNKLSVQ